MSGVWQAEVMNTSTPSYHEYRFQSEIITHAVWLYQVFVSIQGD
jgi:hypothetical protein